MTNLPDDEGLREELKKCFVDTEMQHDDELTLFDTDMTIESIMALISQKILEARQDELGRVEPVDEVIIWTTGDDPELAMTIKERIAELESTLTTKQDTKENL